MNEKMQPNFKTLRHLHTKVICKNDMDSVKDILQEFTTVASNLFEDDTLPLKNYEELIDVIKLFIIHMHVKQVTIEGLDDKRYYDLMAGLVSCYIDILFSIQKKKKLNKLKLMGKNQLISSISAFLVTIFAKSKVHILDSLIQLQSNAVLKRKYIGPILFQLCEDEIFVSTPEKYMKTIIIFKYFTRNCPRAVKIKLQHKALKLKRPSGLIQWLKELKQKQTIKLLNKFSPKKWTRLFLSRKFNNKLITKLLEEFCKPFDETSSTVDKTEVVIDEMKINVKTDGQIEDSVLYFTDKGDMQDKMDYDSENSSEMENFSVDNENEKIDLSFNSKLIHNDSKKKSISTKQFVQPHAIVSTDKSNYEINWADNFLTEFEQEMNNKESSIEIVDDTDECFKVTESQMEKSNSSQNLAIEQLEEEEGYVISPELGVQIENSQESEDLVMKMSDDTVSECVSSESGEHLEQGNASESKSEIARGKDNCKSQSNLERFEKEDGNSLTEITRKKPLKDNEIVDLINESESSFVNKIKKLTEDAKNTNTECKTNSFEENSSVDSGSLSEKCLNDILEVKSFSTSTPFSINIKNTASDDFLPPFSRSPRVVLTDFRKQLENDSDLNLRLSLSSNDNPNLSNMNDDIQSEKTLNSPENCSGNTPPVPEDNTNSSLVIDHSISNRLRKRRRQSEGKSLSKKITKIKKRQKSAVSLPADRSDMTIEIRDLNDVSLTPARRSARLAAMNPEKIIGTVTGE